MAWVPQAWSRPLLTEVSETVGRFAFETGFSLSYRDDAFEGGRRTYETVHFPVFARFGAARTLDFGFQVEHVSHRIETPSARFSGSATGRLQLESKWSPVPWAGVHAVWEAPSEEKDDQELPIGRGSNYGVTAIVRLPVPGSVHLNAGYVWRGPYESRFGVRGGPAPTVRPGDIASAKAAVEIPLRWNFHLLTEAAYFDVGEQEIGGQPIVGTDGEALDLLVGAAWEWAGWRIASGVAFGMLDESHTSFDLERGGGDWKALFRLAYRLDPSTLRKPS